MSETGKLFFGNLIKKAENNFQKKQKAKKKKKSGIPPKSGRLTSLYLTKLESNLFINVQTKPMSMLSDPVRKALAMSTAYPIPTIRHVNWVNQK